MDTLSSSVSSFKVPTLSAPPTNTEFQRFKSTSYAATNTNRPTQPQTHVSSSSTPNLVPKKTSLLLHKCSAPLPFSSSKNTSPLNPSSPIFHRNPVTGYAAALIDVAQTNNSLHWVQRDVQRLLKFLQHLNFQSVLMVEELKERVVKDMAEKGNFHRHVVVVLKMLLKKKKAGMVQQVLEEFERIYDELCGTQIVLVSSKTQMREDELFGIAKGVHQLSGALRVKVRNLARQSNHSFASP